MDLRDKLIQALQGYTDGLDDARATYLSLTRLGPAVDASGDAQLLDLWEQAFTLLSELNHGVDAEAATRVELRKLLEASNNTTEARVTLVQVQRDSWWVRFLAVGAATDAIRDTHASVAPGLIKNIGLSPLEPLPPQPDLGI